MVEKDEFIYILSKTERMYYGPEAITLIEDILGKELIVLLSLCLEKHRNISEYEIKEIASATIQQSQADNWHSEMHYIFLTSVEFFDEDD